VIVPYSEWPTWLQVLILTPNALLAGFSLEWIGMGEMARPEDDLTPIAKFSRSNYRTHWNGAHLNLVGASATGLFYLAIRRGIDYLCQHPNVDSRRIGATGLSGGAWQTIMIGSLDERIAVAIPSCGYFAFTSAIERNSDVGDMEYHPCDLFSEGGDYSTLTAMMAPRPTMLIYGETDQYGLRAPLQKPHLYDEIKPFFKLYGKEDDLAFYANIDPGTHNYQLDCCQQSYAFSFLRPRSVATRSQPIIKPTLGQTSVLSQKYVHIVAGLLQRSNPP
jgi:hypothetical protein